jgi:hypothetical protein
MVALYDYFRTHDDTILEHMMIHMKILISILPLSQHWLNYLTNDQELDMEV